MPRLATLTALVATLDAPAAGGEPRLVRCHKSRWGSVFRVQYVPPGKATITCEDVCVSKGQVCQTAARASSCTEYHSITAGSAGVNQSACQYPLAPGRTCSCAVAVFAAMMADLGTVSLFDDHFSKRSEPDVRTCVEGVASSTVLVLEIPGEPASMPTCNTVCAESSFVHGRCVGHLQLHPGKAPPWSCGAIPQDGKPSRDADGAGQCGAETYSGTGCLCAAERPLLCGMHRGMPVIITSRAASRAQCASECAVAGFDGYLIGQFLGKGFDSCEEAMVGEATAPFAQAVGSACRCFTNYVRPVVAAQRVCYSWPGETRVQVTDLEGTFSCNQLCEARDDFWPSKAVCGGTFGSRLGRRCMHVEVPVAVSAHVLEDDCERKVGGQLVCRCIPAPQ